MPFKQPPLNKDQIVMFAQCLDDMLPRDSSVRIIGEIMDKLDWKRFESGYSKLGCSAYPPKTLAKILVYAYSNSIRSSRKIEDLVKNDKRYIWLAEGLEPDHNTISRFRKSKSSDLKDLFIQSIKLCSEAGLVLLDIVSIDSTKIAACASKKSLLDKAQIAKELAAIEKIFNEAEDVDSLEDAKYGSGNNGREIPEDLKDPIKRKEKLEKIAKRMKEERSKNISSSDPESKIMKVSGNLKPGYSMQAAVDSKKQVIVGMELTDCNNDYGKLSMMVNEVFLNLGEKPNLVLADRGYSDEATYEWIEESGQDAIVVPKEHPKNKDNSLFSARCFIKSERADEYLCPAGRVLNFKYASNPGSGNYRSYCAQGCKSCSFQIECVGSKRANRRISVSVVADTKEKMRRILSSKDGKRKFAQRKQTVEPVFGQIKANRKFDRFSVWGKAGAKAECTLACLVHNLMKYAKNCPDLLHFLSKRSVFANIQNFLEHFKSKLTIRKIYSFGFAAF